MSEFKTDLLPHSSLRITSEMVQHREEALPYYLPVAPPTLSGSLFYFCGVRK
jgi:hypothetical protein